MAGWIYGQPGMGGLRGLRGDLDAITTHHNFLANHLRTCITDVGLPLHKVKLPSDIRTGQLRTLCIRDIAKT